MHPICTTDFQEAQHVMTRGRAERIGTRLPLPAGERDGVRGFGRNMERDALDERQSFHSGAVAQESDGCRAQTRARPIDTRLPLPAGERDGVRGFGRNMGATRLHDVSGISKTRDCGAQTRARPIDTRLPLPAAERDGVRGFGRKWSVMRRWRVTHCIT